VQRAEGAAADHAGLHRIKIGSPSRDSFQVSLHQSSIDIDTQVQLFQR